MFASIDLGTFERRTGLQAADGGSWKDAIGIVSLRDVRQIIDIRVMSQEYLERLLQSVTLAGDPSCRPYAGCKIRRMQIDPKMVSIGQTFVQKEKCSIWLDENPVVDKLFAGHDVPVGPLAKRTMRILGRTARGELAIAHYLTPIIERHEYRHVFLDGIHRAYTALRMNPSIEVIKVSGVTTPFPADFMSWRDVRVTDAKPPKSERYFGLKEAYFRDLKDIGIDG